MSVIISIDHSIGDLTQYTSTVTGGGDLSVSAEAALAGTNYGLSCLINDTTVIYGVKTVSSNTSGKLRIRFYIDPNSLAMANANMFEPWALKTGTTYISYLEFYYFTASGYRLQPWLNLDSGDTSLAQTTITDEPHYVEIYITRAATNVSSDGTFSY